MKRRNLLQIPFSVLFASTLQAAPPPWSARLLVGGFDGTAWNAGLAITLTENWKTYWRVPGDGGIAPLLEVSGDNIKQSRVDLPAPTRFRDAAGMTIGYKKEVVFLLAVEPIDAARPVSLALKSFFGVCDVVCIPAQFAQDLTFDPDKSAAPDQILISEWKKRVPVLKPQGVAAPPFEPVLKASAEMKDGKPVLNLLLAETMRDIFIEGNPKHYFGEPEFTLSQATLDVSGTQSLDELRATRLRVTLISESVALEQMVTVV
jgi:DsbC/DsbD-like thiol-disulfide interchange protein